MPRTLEEWSHEVAVVLTVFLMLTVIPFTPYMIVSLILMEWASELVWLTFANLWGLFMCYVALEGPFEDE